MAPRQWYSQLIKLMMAQQSWTKARSISIAIICFKADNEKVYSAAPGMLAYNLAGYKDVDVSAHCNKY